MDDAAEVYCRRVMEDPHLPRNIKGVVLEGLTYVLEQQSVCCAVCRAVRWRATAGDGLTRSRTNRSAATSSTHPNTPTPQHPPPLAPYLDLHAPHTAPYPPPRRPWASLRAKRTP